MTEEGMLIPDLINSGLERACLYKLFVYPEEIPLIDMAPTDFAVHRNAAVFEAMRALSDMNQAVDIETVHNQLISTNKVERAGGYGYLIEIIRNSEMISFATPQDYARDLVELSIRRQLFREANELVRAAMDRTKSVHDTISEFSVRLPRLVKVRGGAQHIGVFASQHYDRVREAMEHPELAALRSMKTGMTDFDDITSGLRNGELILLLGKPGLGKTKWAHQAGAQLAKNRFPGVIFQCETSEEEIMDREFSRETHIPSDHLEFGTLEDDEIIIYTRAVETISSPNNPLYLSFNSGWNTVTLRAELTRMKAEYNIRWFIFDYMRFLTDRYGDSETERENHISIQIKRICRDLEIAGIVIHSMNKSGIASASPELEHGSGGAGISYDCDKALFMIEHQPENKDAPKYTHYRTFVFRKSRRKIKRPVFHMQALKDRPEFVDVTPEDPDDTPPPPPQRRRVSQFGG